MELAIIEEAVASCAIEGNRTTVREAICDAVARSEYTREEGNILLALLKIIEKKDDI